MKEVIEMLQTEVERMESLSVRLHAEGKESRSAYRRNESKRLRAIIEVMQKKT